MYNLHISIDADYNRDRSLRLCLYFTHQVLKCYVNTYLKRSTIRLCQKFAVSVLFLIRAMNRETIKDV